MERITMTMDEGLIREFDRLIQERGYTNRSEAMRDLLRREIEDRRGAREDEEQCVASLSYVYDHHQRDLGERLLKEQHRHHELMISTMHVHLDHKHCLETVVLKGPVASVRALADRTQAEREVRHIALNLITVTAGDTHRHAASDHKHSGHLHLIPRS